MTPNHSPCRAAISPFWGMTKRKVIELHDLPLWTAWWWRSFLLLDHWNGQPVRNSANSNMPSMPPPADAKLLQHPQESSNATIWGCHLHSTYTACPLAGGSFSEADHDKRFDDEVCWQLIRLLENARKTPTSSKCRPRCYWICALGLEHWEPRQDAMNHHLHFQFQTPWALLGWRSRHPGHPQSRWPGGRLQKDRHPSSKVQLEIASHPDQISKHQRNSQLPGRTASESWWLVPGLWLGLGTWIEKSRLPEPNLGDLGWKW